MVATKRDDGLYDVPGLNFAVPLEYVPDEHKPPPDGLYNPTPSIGSLGPDLRLAAGEGGSTSTQQNPGRFEPQASPAPPPADIPRSRNDWGMEGQSAGQSVNNMSTSAGPSGGASSVAAPNAPQKVDLEPGPGEHAAGAVPPSRTPMDDQFAAQIMRAGRGSYAPGGDRMIAQQWLQQNEAVNPSERNAPQVLTDPETGDPMMTPAQSAEPRFAPGGEKVSKSVASAMAPGYEPGTVPGTNSEMRHYLKPKEQSHVVGWKPPVEEKPIIGSGAQEFENRQERQKMMEATAADQAQGAMRREARRDLNAGRYLQGVADREGADIDKAQAEYDQQKAELDDVKMQIQHIAKSLPQMAQQMKPPPDTQSHFGLAIAQSLMVLGGRPFVNLVREAIQDDFQREQAMMHWALQGHQVQLGALSTLAHLTARTRDPVAAAHAFAALRWQQAQHQLEAFNVQAMGGRKSDEAQQMYEQMEVAKQHELKQMLGSTHTRQWATVPAQSSGGGIAGVDRWIDHSFHDKKQAHAVKQHVYGQIAKGEPITMPKFDENGQITRTDERIGEFSAGTAVRLPSWLDTRQPVVHTHHPSEGDSARKAFDAAETGEMLLKEAEGILKHAGARINPTTATQLDMVLTQMLSVAKNFDKDGTLKIAELPILEKRIGMNAIRNITSPSDAQAIIDFSRKIMRKSAASQGGVHQMTMTPGGSDYWDKGATKEGKNAFRAYGGVVEGTPEE